LKPVLQFKDDEVESEYELPVAVDALQVRRRLA
jgi:hypothetical protein